MKPPTISVVIPAYNAAETICAALDSVCSQTTAPDEVVVVDDLSRDTTCDVVREYINAMPEACRGRVSLVQQEENRGPAAARNRGISATNGKWVAFLDGDDVWLPYRIETQMQISQASPKASLICSPTLPLSPAASTSPPPPSPGFSALSLEDFIYANPVATSTVLIKRDALDATGGFDEQFRGPEDYDLWLRVMVHHGAVIAEAPLSLYRHVPGSLSMDDRTFLPQVIAVLEKAFAPGGALERYANCKRRAFAEKYSSASWMAFNRGDRPAALRQLIRSFRTHIKRIEPETRDPLLRVKLLLLYLGIYTGSKTHE